MRRLCPVVLLSALLAGCSAQVVRVDMDPARLAAPAASARAKNLVALACPHRLGDVVDARPAGGDAGGLGWNAFRFDAATETVRSQLAAAGLTATSTQADAPEVTVRVMQLYLAQNLQTKIPVAVYEVKVASETPFLLRSQKASMNWNGTQDEAYAAYARALSDISQQLVGVLNQRCGKG